MVLIGWAFFLVLVGSSVFGTSDLILTAEPGENITLICRDPENSKILTLEWSRTDLQDGKHVFVNRSGAVNEDDQHESFRNRVSLLDDQMKDGDLSVVLKNLTIKDNGTYQCRVIRENDPQREPKLISTINLQVSPPPGEGDEDEGGAEEKDKGGDKGELGKVKEEDVGGVSRGRFGLIPVPGLLLLLVVLVLAVLLCIYKKKKKFKSKFQQQNPQCDLLSSDRTTDSSVVLQISSDPDPDLLKL